MKYIATDNYILRDVAGDSILFARGEDTLECNNVMVFNETGALIYRALSQPTDIDTLAGLLVDKYKISLDEARTDTKVLLDKMLSENIIKTV